MTLVTSFVCNQTTGMFTLASVAASDGRPLYEIAPPVGTPFAPNTSASVSAVFFYFCPFSVTEQYSAQFSATTMLGACVATSSTTTTSSTTHHTDPPPPTTTTTASTTSTTTTKEPTTTTTTTTPTTTTTTTTPEPGPLVVARWRLDWIEDIYGMSSYYSVAEAGAFIREPSGGWSLDYPYLDPYYGMIQPGGSHDFSVSAGASNYDRIYAQRPDWHAEANGTMQRSIGTPQALWIRYDTNEITTTPDYGQPPGDPAWYYVGRGLWAEFSVRAVVQIQ